MARRLKLEIAETAEYLENGVGKLTDEFPI
jgi:hypothetical protein